MDDSVMGHPHMEPKHMMTFPIRWNTVLAAVTALLIHAPAANAARKQAAPMPDLTAGGKPDDASAVPLGPTGMRGWIYHQHLDTSEARQILVTVVEKGSPADGKLQLKDVILGASGNGRDPAAFDSDARLQLAEAINDAEARDPAELRLLVWRKGKTQVLPLKLRTMGTYSATAPFDCPKSAKILEEALDHLAKQEDFGRFEWAMLGLLAGNDPANPKSAQRMESVRRRLPEMLLSKEEIDAIMSGEIETDSKAPWRRGHTLIVLAEYYLQTKDKSVLPTIEACALSIANGQSIYGTMGHLYQRPNEDGSRGSITGYGPVNSAALPALLGLVLARECGIDRPELEPAIQRGATFFAYYAGKGAIPYGEHNPLFKGHENNGKSGQVALIMRRVDGREKESAFFAKMAAASFLQREGGHTGPYFNYQWAPLGAYAGSREALIMHFKHIRWHLDLCRRWDGGFAFSKMLGKKDVPDYSGLDPIVPALLTYAAPLRQLVITGKGLEDELLDKADVEQAEFAALYDSGKRSEKELVSDLSCWSPKVKFDAAAALVERAADTNELVPVLVAKAKDSKSPARVGALWALGRTENALAARVLAESLSDKDPLVRFVAAESMRLLPHELKMAEVETILRACASTFSPKVPGDPQDPVQFAHGRICMLLFYGGSAYGPKGVLSGKEVADVDRALLYPAIRAVAANPAGQCRATLKSVYEYLTEEDLLALADTVVTSVVERAPADSMFSASIRRSGVELLREFGYIEAEKAAALVIEDTNDNRKPKAVEELAKPEGYEPSKSLKRIVSVNAKPSVTEGSSRTALLSAQATDASGQPLLFAWSKVEGPGHAVFTPNNTAEASNAKVVFDAPGRYVLQLALTDRLGLSEVSRQIELVVE